MLLNPIDATDIDWNPSRFKNKKKPESRGYAGRKKFVDPKKVNNNITCVVAGVVNFARNLNTVKSRLVSFSSTISSVIRQKRNTTSRKMTTEDNTPTVIPFAFFFTC